MNAHTITFDALVNACIALNRATRALDRIGQGDLGTVCMDARWGLMAELKDVKIFIDMDKAIAKDTSVAELTL